MDIEIRGRKTDKHPGFTHEFYDKSTGEPVLHARKSDYGDNTYSSEPHKDFLAAHKHVLLPHTIGDMSERNLKPDHIRNKAYQALNKAYREHYSADEPKTSYTHEGVHHFKNSNGDKLKYEKYALHDKDKKHILDFYTEKAPGLLRSGTPIKHIVKNDDYEGIHHYDTAKVKHSRLDVGNIKNISDYIHELKNKPEPRFVGANSASAHHKTFKTSLPQKEAIDAYTTHLLDEDSDLDLHSKSEHGSVLKTNAEKAGQYGTKHTHMIHYIDGHIHHTTLNDVNSKTNSNIIESAQ